MKKIIIGLAIFVSVFAFLSVVARPATIISPNYYNYMPRVYFSGYGGSGLLGQGDVLAPVFTTPGQNLFFYGQGRLSHAKEAWAKNPWTGSLGLGYRRIFAGAVVVGAYVLGDYSRTKDRHALWSANPGIEVLGKYWEFRANGYIPVGKDDWKVEGWASDFGNYNYIWFKGHDQYDAKFIYHEEAGPGADAEIGRTLFNVHNVEVKGYVNGYYFNMEHNDDVYGAGARVTIEPNTYLEILLDGTYDRHERGLFMAGLRVSLYDLFSHNSTVLNPRDLNRKLFEPIERNFSTIASGDDLRVTGGPDDQDQESPEVVEPEGPQFDNVWFFDGSTVVASGKAGAGAEDGTYEHPYLAEDFNQKTVDLIRDHSTGGRLPILYFNHGTYTTTESAEGPYTRVEIYPGMELEGREGIYKGFQKPATDPTKIKFIGNLMLASNTALKNLMLVNDSANTNDRTAITMNGASGVLMDDVVIGANDNNTGYDTDISLDNGSSLLMDNSTAYSYNNKFSASVYTFAIRLDNASSITLNNNMLETYAKGSDSSSGWGLTRNIYADNNSVVNIGDSNKILAEAIGGNATGGTGTQYVYAGGVNVDLTNGSIVNVGSNNTFDYNATGGTADGATGVSSIGAQALGFQGNNGSTINFNGDNNIIDIVTKGGSAPAIGSVTTKSRSVAVRNIGGIVNVKGRDNIYEAESDRSTVGGIPSGAAEAVGISGEGTGSILNFSSASLGTVFDVAGKTDSYGIEITNGQLQIDNAAQNATEILSKFVNDPTFTKFTNNSGNNNGAIISWNAVDFNWY